MKLNSNTIILKHNSDEYKTIEKIITKIASENNVDNVNRISISLNKDNGLVTFSKEAGVMDKIERLEAGSLPKPELEDLKQELLARLRTVRPGSGDERFIRDHLQMIDEQLEADASLGQASLRDPYSFAVAAAQ